MYQRYHLSHTDALNIVTNIKDILEKEDKGAAIAVADTQGELLAFLRTDGCRLPSITIAINKAFTAAREQKESWDIGYSSREKPFPMTNFGDLRYTAWGGGVPITYRDEVIGAVGVSGLQEHEDIELARMGAKLVGEGV
jgi:glc operon protein GlcG